jgi:hypothetical protein
MTLLFERLPRLNQQNGWIVPRNDDYGENDGLEQSDGGKWFRGNL